MEAEKFYTVNLWRPNYTRAKFRVWIKAFHHLNMVVKLLFLSKLVDPNGRTGFFTVV